jgi:hypothetical protein
VSVLEKHAVFFFRAEVMIQGNYIGWQEGRVEGKALSG